MLEDLEGGLLEYETIGEFLADIKKKFERGDEELVKVVKLKRLEQESKTIEEFIQEFRRVAKSSRYEGRLLMEGVKRTNTVMVCPQQGVGLVQCNLYAIDIDRRRN